MTAGNLRNDDRAVRAFSAAEAVPRRPAAPEYRNDVAVDHSVDVAADRRPRREARPRQEAGAWLVWTDMNDGPRPVVLGIYRSELEALRFAVNGPYTGVKVTRTPWGPLDLDKRGGW